ncbi:EpsD family peptidyl-prolyl cis-trans isomerase [Duganella violaceipulchra]|uniref:peptidylprolyl isomerase n=1 Tax=Duganella violaceipulchra TaxID=2849652 RepID=A0AA41H3I3_9BURK|nr:EpsD family peptidyl-prolyl cis-trans isomerase [Duganella violaceicalia]MBV6319957.1 EpsD family peptidyl-prolyl cis-trans isomerase [Duganella violaceicalia]MCP2010321.1 EpsD family peptidyl-prolyl cis-trans isomerase [Duganella violaceicalia]
MNHTATVRFGRGAIYLAVVVALGLVGCGNSKEKKPGQTLVSVNGEEITILQLNEELARANVPVAQQAAARKQLIESLVDRQLLLNQAAKDKTDRDPKVVQAIERAKALIVAQSYLQKQVGAVARPTKAEIGEYFDKHADLFAHRKTLDMRQLVVASADMNDAAKAAIDASKSLDELAGWFDTHGVKYARAQSVRSSADLPPELAAKLLAMPKGERFIVREGDRSIIASISEVRETPVTLEASSNQIEQFLYNKKIKDASDAEIARLRAAAKIDYVNPADQPGAKAAPAAATPPGAASAAPALAPAAAPATPAEDINARGVAGLK